MSPNLYMSPSQMSMSSTLNNKTYKTYYSTNSLGHGHYKDPGKMTVKEATLKRNSLMRTNLSLNDLQHRINTRWCQCFCLLTLFCHQVASNGVYSKASSRGTIISHFPRTKDSAWISQKTGITTEIVSVRRIEKLTLRIKISNISGASITNM